MNNYSMRMSVEDIDGGHGDTFAQHILSVWRKSEGNLTDDYIKAYPKLVLFDGQPNAGDSPNLLDCGHDALPLKLLGRTWAQSSEKLRSFLPNDYRAMIGRAYFDAATRQLPVFDIVRAEMQNDDGISFDAFYHRLILPVREFGGSRFLLSYSFLFGKQHQVLDTSSSSETPADRTLGTRDYANLFQSGAFSSQKRLFRTY